MLGRALPHRKIIEEKRTVTVLQEKEECDKAGGRIIVYDALNNTVGRYTEITRLSCIKPQSSAFTVPFRKEMSEAEQYP